MGGHGLQDCGRGYDHRSVTGEEIDAAKEILEKMIKKSVVKSKSWMPEFPLEKFVLPLSQWANNRDVK